MTLVMSMAVLSPEIGCFQVRPVMTQRNSLLSLSRLSVAGPVHKSLLLMHVKKNTRKLTTIVCATTTA